MAQVRPYRGVEAADGSPSAGASLLEAGLDLLGGPTTRRRADGPRHLPAGRRLAARYFYESFADKDEFVAAVFDWVIADIAATTQAAVAAAPPDEQTRAGMANIVRTIADDARVGRLLFSAQLANAVLVRKRAESGALFAMLSGQHVETALQRAGERPDQGRRALRGRRRRPDDQRLAGRRRRPGPGRSWSTSCARMLDRARRAEPPRWYPRSPAGGRGTMLPRRSAAVFGTVTGVARR